MLVLFDLDLLHDLVAEALLAELERLVQDLVDRVWLEEVALRSLDVIAGAEASLRVEEAWRHIFLILHIHILLLVSLIVFGVVVHLRELVWRPLR